MKKFGVGKGLVTLIAVLCVCLFLIPSANFGADEKKSDAPAPSDMSAKRGDHVVLTFSFAPTLTTRTFRGALYDDLSLSNTNYWPVAGEPQVPFAQQTLYTVGKIDRIEVVKSDPRPFLLNLPPAPKSTNPYDAPVTFKGPVWNDDSFFPGRDSDLTQIGVTIGRYVTSNDYTLYVYPLQYNPTTGAAILYREVTVNIYMTSTRSSSSQQDVNNDGSVRDITQEPARGYSDFTMTGGNLTTRYLIITKQKYYDDLKPLVDWKTKKGVPVQLVDVDWIVTNMQGNDTPDKMRNYIKKVYAETQTGLEYVLLAGDHDVVPTRECKDLDPYPGWDDGKCPSDTYFACLGQNSARFWDGDLDNQYAEMGELDDKTPEVWVTRIAITSETAMGNWAREMVAYECNQTDDGAFASDAGLAAGNSQTAGDSNEQSDYLWSKYFSKVYSNKVAMYEGTTSIDPATINNNVNGGLGILNFIDHGGPTVWCKNYGSSISYQGANVVGTNNGDQKPIVSVMACLTNWFDDPSGCGYESFSECIGESWTEANIQNGALGYAGFSRSATAALSQQYFPGADGLQEDFASQIFQGNIHLGKTFNNAKKHYAEVWGGYFTEANKEVQCNWIEYNFLGDAEEPLWTGAGGRFNVTTTQTHEVYEKVNVEVKDQSSSPVQNAMVCVEGLGLGIYAYKLTDSSGKATFEMEVYGNTTVNLTVTKESFVPYVSTAIVHDMIPPATTFSITPATPDGSNNWYHMQPTIHLVGNEPGTLIYYRWNGGNLTLYTGTDVPAISGNNQFSFFSKDLAGNEENPQAKTILYDSKSPATSAVTEPATPNGNNGWFIENKPLINISVDDDHASTLTTYCSWDNLLEFTYQGPFEAKEGEHTLYYYSQDSSGYVEAKRSLNIKVDATAPDVDVSLSPAAPDGSEDYYISPLSITLTKGSTDDLIRYKWDQAADFSPYVSVIEALDGCHTLYYFSEDVHGNLQAVQAISYKMDITPPVTNLTLSPATPSGENEWYKAKPAINLSQLYEYDRSGTTIYYYWDDNFEDPYQYGGELKALEGEHTLHYWAQDMAGNIEEAAEVALKVDSQVPVSKFVCNLESDKGGWYRDSPVVKITTDANSHVYYTYDGSDEKEWPGTQEIKLDPGYHTFTYYAADEAGNREPVTTKTLNVDFTPPVAYLDAPTDAEVGKKVFLNASQSSDDVGIDKYYFDYGDDQNSGWTSLSTMSHKYNESKKYTVTVKVRDASGQVSQQKANVNIKAKGINIPGVAGGEDMSGVIILLFVLLVVIAAVVVILVVVVKGRGKKRKAKNGAPSQPAVQAVVAPEPVPATPSAPLPSPQAQTQNTPSRTPKTPNGNTPTAPPQKPHGTTQGQTQQQVPAPARAVPAPAPKPAQQTIATQDRPLLPPPPSPGAPGP